MVCRLWYSVCAVYLAGGHGVARVSGKRGCGTDVLSAAHHSVDSVWWQPGRPIWSALVGDQVPVAGDYSSGWTALSIGLIDAHVQWFVVVCPGMGTVQAFVTPSRDGLLSQVAGAEVQRAVVKTSLVQFGLQMIGLGLSTLADQFGPEPLVIAQIVALLFGASAYARIPKNVDAHVEEAGQGEKQTLLSAVKRSLKDGAKTVFASAPMRSIIWLNIAMGVFFMGAYMVATPLLIREHYSTDTSALAILNATNSLGLFLMALLLLRIGTLVRPGRALLLAQIFGGLVLALGYLTIGYAVLVAIIFVWGLCGGVAMSMSRTVMQELAPVGQRGRVMSFYSLAMMGAGPLGALWAGYMCEWLDARTTLLINGLGMAVFTALIYRTRNLAELRITPQPANQAETA